MQKDRKILIMKTISNAIDILIEMAFKEFDTHPKLSKRHLEMTWNLSKGYKIRLGKRRRLFCTRCFTPWIQGKTVSIKKDNGNSNNNSNDNKNSSLFIYKCLCGYTRKIPHLDKEFKPNHPKDNNVVL